MIQLDIELKPSVEVKFEPSIVQIKVGEVRTDTFDININEIQKLDAVGSSLGAGEMTRKRKITLQIEDLEAFEGFNKVDNVKVDEILGRFGRKLR